MATTGTPTSAASLASCPLRSRVSPQEVLLELDVDRAVSVPVQVPPEEIACLADASVRRQPGERPVSPARQQDYALGMTGQVGGVQPRPPPVRCGGDGHEPRDV